MLPLVVKQQLGLGAGVYGALLGLMGVGGVAAGLLLPQARARLSRGNTVFFSGLLSFAGMLILAASRHWLPAAGGMLIFGIGWVASSAVAQGAAQLSAPPWVRSRALAIYQLAFNGALAAGTFFWGWLGNRVGLPSALTAAALTGIVLAVSVRRFGIDGETRAAPATAPPAPQPADDVAPELATILTEARGRVLEFQRYHVAPQDRDAFLAAMIEVRDARGRAGALLWQLYEDVSDPNGWMELWSVENWTDHLREAVRMSEDDRQTIARALAFNRGTCPPLSRYLAVNPSHKLPAPRLSAAE
jgi:MFS family permease